MENVTLKMIDLLTEEEVVRTIDISNAFTGNELKKDKVRENLEEWIENRGNSQHETFLELISWELK